MMTIKQVADATGVSPDTLRYYEREGLLAPPVRAANGYRQYDVQAVRRVRFVRTAQSIGFSLEEIQALLFLKGDNRACCRDVRGLAIAKRKELQEKIHVMQAMNAALNELITVCNEDLRNLDECPILGALEQGMAQYGPEADQSVR